MSMYSNEYAPETIEIVDWPSDEWQSKQPNSLERRRASHNAVERRRRDTITEKIRELGAMIPDDFSDPVTGHCSNSERQHKSVVLQRSVEYMRFLQHSHNELVERLAQLEVINPSIAPQPNGNPLNGNPTAHLPSIASRGSVPNQHQHGHAPSSADFAIEITHPLVKTELYE